MEYSNEADFTQNYKRASLNNEFNFNVQDYDLNGYPNKANPAHQQILRKEHQQQKNINQFFDNFNQDMILLKQEDQYDRQKMKRMYKYPANYQEAVIHSYAFKYGYGVKDIQMKNMNAKEPVPICPCCQKFAFNHQIPLCYPTTPPVPEKGKEKFLLQTGVTLYFFFIKMVIGYLLIRFLVFDILTMILSSNGSFCSLSRLAQKNSSFQCFTLSGYNLKSSKDQTSLDIISICGLLFTIISIIYFFVMRQKQRKLIRWLDRNNRSQQQFSVLLQNIPLIIYQNEKIGSPIVKNYKKYIALQIESIIKKWLDFIGQKKQHLRQQELQIDFYDHVFNRSINYLRQKPDYKSSYVKDKINYFINYQNKVPTVSLCYDLTGLENVNNLRLNLINKFNSRHKFCNFCQDERQNPFLERTPEQIQTLNLNHLKLCENMAKDPTEEFNLSNFTGKAFVTFRYQHYRDYFLRQHQKNPYFFSINESPIKISLAPRPENVYWQNMKVTDEERSKNIIYSYAVLFMLLILSFASLLGLQILKNKLAKDQSSNENQNVFNLIEMLKKSVVVVGMAIFTNVINFILNMSIQLLSNMERHKTINDRLATLVIKNIVTQTLNTVFIYYILLHDTPLSQKGLYVTIFNLVLVSGFMTIGLQMFPPAYFYHYFKNLWVYRQKNKTYDMFQIELNKTLQLPQFNFAAMYSFYIVFTFAISFYGFLVPSATPILIFIFAIQYWIDKYNILKRYSCPIDFGPQLIRSIFGYFQVSVFLFTIGYLIWDFQIHTEASSTAKVLNFINLFISFLFVIFQLFVPKRLKQKFFCKQSKMFQFFSFSNYLKTGQIKKTYFVQNPVTSCVRQVIANDQNNQQDIMPSNPQFIQSNFYQYYINMNQTLYKNDELAFPEYLQLDIFFYQRNQSDGFQQIQKQRQFIKAIQRFDRQLQRPGSV